MLKREKLKGMIGETLQYVGIVLLSSLSALWLIIKGNNMANPKLYDIVQKYRCSTNELLWVIFLFLLIPIWIGLAPKWYSWFATDGNGLWMKWLYGFLNDLYPVNIPIAIFMSYFAYRWNVRIREDNDCRPFRFILVLIALVLLWYGGNVVYANIVWGLDYRMFLSCWLAFTLFIQTSKIVRTIVNIHKDLSKNGDIENVESNKIFKGFSLDKPEENNNLKQYASLIAKKLISTDISAQSYAIGITGKWGVGKTTFLNLLKNEIAEKAEIVEFNPWMCRSPEQVTNDFFASLRHQLSPKHSTLSKSIKEYAKYINNITFEPHKAFGIEMSIPLKEDSLYEKKKILSEKFSRLSHPVVVFIDDIDRLEREEVFEVLRLIRNTADLNNTIYIVAYDKEYVTSVLEEKDIKDAASYLEKIFPVEVHLPKVDDSLIWKTLRKDFSKQDKFKGFFTKKLFAQFSYNERIIILRVLNNYRRAKRFARLYMLNFDYITEQYKGEIKLLDLFWLELLQMYDKKVYDKLADDPYNLLYIEKDRDRFCLKKGILHSFKGNEDNAYDGDKYWKNETPQILEQMFGQFIKTRKESICYLENFDKYFALSVSPNKLSFNALKELFSEENDPEKTVIQWVDSGKYFNSIAYQLSHVYIKDLSNNLLKNYLYGILTFALKIVPYRNTQMGNIKEMLQEYRYKDIGKKDIAHDNALAWFNGKLGDERNILYLSRLLNKLYLTRIYDQDNQEVFQCTLLISNEEIESLLISGMQTYLDRHPELTACDLIKKGTTLFRLFKSCCLITDDNIVIDGGYGSIYKQVTFKTVIDYFERKDEKPTLKEYEELYASLYSQETLAFTDPIEEDAYWDYMEYSMEYEMKRTFGDSCDSDLEEFKNKCFMNE